MNKENKVIPVVLTAIALAAVPLAGRAEAPSIGATFADYAVGEALSNKGATGGGWLPIIIEEETEEEDRTSATNILMGTENALDVHAPDPEQPITFTNTTTIGSNKACYDFRVSFDLVHATEGLAAEADACGISMGQRSDASLALAGAAGGTWHILSAPGFQPALDTLYDVRIETRQIGEDVYAAFFVKIGNDYATLVDASGLDLFPLQRKASEPFSRLTFTGNGTLASFTGGAGDVEPAVARDWQGEDGGEWSDANNWSGGAVPTTGQYARVSGLVRIVNGKESAKVSNLFAYFNANGQMVIKSGVIGTDLTLDYTDIDTRPLAGAPYAVNVGTFLGYTPPVTCTWLRGSTAKVYESEPVSTSTSYTLQESDYCHWFKVTAEGPLDATLAKEFYFSKLPVFYLTTDDGLTPTAAKEEHKGKIVSQFGRDVKSKWSNDNLFNGKITIKVRGNSTAGQPKKPWKIKLDTKTAMFGYKKNKHWVLLANYLDESNLRNKLAYDFANEIGSLGMESTWVECVLNGEWQGCYQFCEHIRIASDRVDIFNWEDEAEDRGESTEDFSWVDPEVDNITGGYLFESSNEYDELTKFTVKSGNLVLKTMVNSPEYLYTNPAMTNWCANFLQNYCDAITSPDGYSHEDKHWSEYCNNDSMVTYFLVMEMFGNNDAIYKSRYFYKDVDKKMKFGPVWDFDWGVGNGRVTSTNPKSWKVRDNAASFYREWADDPWFCTRLYTIYHKTARAAFAAMLGDTGTIAKDIELLTEAGAANDAKWTPMVGGFATDSAWLRSYLTQRLAWLDEQFVDVPTLVASLKTSTSTTPYTRATDTLPIAFANAPTNFLAQGKALHLAFTVGDATVTKTDVLVNGVRVMKDLAVTNGTFDAVIPASALTEDKGDPNCVAFVAYNATGTLKGRNYAIVTLTDFTPGDATPETTEGGVKIPSVPHEWVCKEVATLPGMGYLTAASDAEFAAAVKAVPSPCSKLSPLWQDYVAGTNPDPTGTNTEFVVTSFTITNGIPYIKYCPDLGTKRAYTMEGKTNLTDEAWIAPAPEGSKFYRVRVALPK